jgi:hypothetical protein
MKKISVLIVDDHILVANGLKNLLDSFGLFSIVGIISKSSDVLSSIKKLSPNVVLMDINMPGENGIVCARNIKKIFPLTKVAILSMHHEEQYVIQASLANVDGYFLKNTEIEELVSGIVKIANGDRYYCSSISDDYLVEKIEIYQPSSELTERGTQDIHPISLGLNNKEIYERLLINDRTVNTHRTNIMQKCRFKMQLSSL